MDPYRVVIVGAGVAGLEVALALRELAGDRASVTLLAPDDEFVYRPMSVREPFGGAVARRYPLELVAGEVGATRCVDSFKWLDPVGQVIHTTGGAQLGYDAAVLAVGASRKASLRHVLTLDERHLDEQLHGLIQDVEEGFVKTIAFVVPSAHCWPFPAYELALMTAKRADEMNVELRVTVLTPEETPLAIFGANVSDAVGELLAERAVEVMTATDCQVREPGKLLIPHTGAVLEVDRIVALPELYGASLAGVPTSARDGFVSVDSNCRVIGLDRVFAAGDTTDFPVKFGGVAALQADAAAEAIAAEAGAEVDPQPFVPVIHGILLGGQRPLYMRVRIADGLPAASTVSAEPFSDTPAKIEAAYLGPFLDAFDRRAGYGAASTSPR